MQHLYLSLVILPRWFAAPIAISAVLLGWSVSAPLSWWVLLPIACSLGVMAWSHTMNTWLDYEWTGLDKGTELERSHSKPYTGGQQVIASGQMISRQVLSVALLWLCVVIILLIVYALVRFNPWIFLICLGSLLVTFWYSWGKLHWQPEIALGVGFGPLAALLGAASTNDPNYLAAFLASIPIFLIFGFAAEIYDQWHDTDVNWERGLRSIGAWVYTYKKSVANVVIVVVMLTYTVQLTLIIADVLSAWTSLTLPALLSLLIMNDAERRKPWAVNLLLGAVFYYCIMLAVGQVVGQ